MSLRITNNFQLVRHRPISICQRALTQNSLVSVAQSKEQMPRALVPSKRKANLQTNSKFIILLSSNLTNLYRILRNNSLKQLEIATPIWMTIITKKKKKKLVHLINSKLWTMSITVLTIYILKHKEMLLSWAELIIQRRICRKEPPAVKILTVETQITSHRMVPFLRFILEMVASSMLRRLLETLLRISRRWMAFFQSKIRLSCHLRTLVDSRTARSHVRRNTTEDLSITKIKIILISLLKICRSPASSKLPEVWLLKNKSKDIQWDQMFNFRDFHLKNSHFQWM